MTKFLHDSNLVNFKESIPEITDIIHNNTYTVEFSPDMGHFLKLADNFELPSEMFGDISPRMERVLHTYFDRDKLTGILMSGEKGSGKSLLSKMLAETLREKHNMPVLIVNKGYHGDPLGQFLARIKQRFVLVFDEFEKVYEQREAQNTLLTMLDGVYKFNALVLMTINDQDKMIDPLINRPGRIFYHYSYGGLDMDTIESYAKKKLKNQEHINDIIKLGMLCSMNFDQLQAVVEEMNRYNEGVGQAIQALNVSLNTQQEFQIKRYISPENELFEGYSSFDEPYINISLNSSRNDEDDEDDEDDEGVLHNIVIWKTVGQELYQQAMNKFMESPHKDRHGVKSSEGTYTVRNHAMWEYFFPFNVNECQEYAYSGYSRESRKNFTPDSVYPVLVQVTVQDEMLIANKQVIFNLQDGGKLYLVKSPFKSYKAF